MSPILLDLGIIKIYWYSIMLLIAFLVGGTIAIKEAGKWKINEDFMINYFFFLIPISLIGARLYFVLFNLSYYKENISEVFRVWEGGMAIHGGIIFGLIWTYIYSKKYAVNTKRLLDIGAVSLVLGQAIGRWGNFFNQEAFGPAVDASTLEGYKIPKFIIDQMFINGEYHHPTFLYESLACIIIFIILLLIRKFSKYLKVGQLASYYLVGYGIIRFMIESLRTDSLMFLDFKAAQIVSIIMIIGGIALSLIFKRGSRFDNLYKEDDTHEGI